MAYADYLHCIRCDCKVIYDANVDYDYLGNGRVMAICGECVDALGAHAMGAVDAILRGGAEVTVETGGGNG